jgi:hypothetical protein
VPKRLLIVNVLLGGVCLFCLAFIVQRLAWAPPAAERPRPGTPSSSPVVAAPQTPRPAVSAYNSIASKSLFSPSRSEAPVGTAGSAIAGPKPNLYGVVVRDPNPIAYLEDPLTKRVAGYRIGDAIAGGTVQLITADSVVISRSDGNIDVRLRDPSKPRPAPPAQPTQPAMPGQLPVPGIPGAPPAGFPPVPQQGVIPPRGMTPQQLVPQGQGPAFNPLMPTRRPSPSLGNRLPLPSASEAIQQPPQPPQ